jgi:preprotein translocase subunit SecB
MASQADPTDNPLNGASDGAPQINALAQYIKDLSVENPSAPQVFQWQATPQLDVQFNLNVGAVSDAVHEVVLRIEIKGRFGPGHPFPRRFELRRRVRHGQRARGGICALPAGRRSAPAVPRFARQIIAEAVQNLGFPPVLLDPIDFAGAYMAQLEASQAGGDAPLGDVEPAGNA